MKLDIINPLEYPKWDEMVSAMKGCSIFHSSGWAKVLRSSYNFNPAYFILSEKGKPRAVIPFMEVRSFLTGTRGVSLTFADYCEPIVDDPDLFPVIFKHIIDFGRKSGWKHIELRGGRKFMAHAPASARYLGHTLDLCANEQELFAHLRSSTRRNIQKASQEGVETKLYTTIQAVSAFYELHCLTRKRHGLPPQPFHFFRNIHEFIISRDNGFVLLASYQGKNVAGGIYFHFGDRALYKYGASDVNYQHLRANNLVMWDAIKWYSHNQYDSFCFGRTDYDNKGLRQFKTGWGATEKEIIYYKYDIGQEAFIENTNDHNTPGTALLSKMPNSILKGIGHILYKHMG